MNPDYEKELELEVDQALRSLPELPAPRTLAPRILAAIRARTAQPWYRQGWQFWPAPLRYAALSLLLGSFGGLCFASWQLTRAAGVQLAWQEVSRTLAGVFALGNALLVVLNGLVLMLKQLNSAILLGCVAGLALAWGICLALGTACVKLAMARR